MSASAAPPDEISPTGAGGCSEPMNSSLPRYPSVPVGSIVSAFSARRCSWAWTEPAGPPTSASSPPTATQVPLSLRPRRQGLSPRADRPRRRRRTAGALRGGRSGGGRCRRAQAGLPHRRQRRGHGAAVRALDRAAREIRPAQPADRAARLRVHGAGVPGAAGRSASRGRIAFPSPGSLVPAAFLQPRPSRYPTPPCGNLQRAPITPSSRQGGDRAFGRGSAWLGSLSPVKSRC